MFNITQYKTGQEAVVYDLLAKLDKRRNTDIVFILFFSCLSRGASWWFVLVDYSLGYTFKFLV